MEQEITGRLEDWYYDKDWKIVWGHLYDDVRYRWDEGTCIHTSSIKIPFEELKEGTVIATLNSKYLLGKPREIEESN